MSVDLERQASGKNAVLAGKRVVITRARSQAGELARRIEELGGEVIEFATIEIQPPAEVGPLDRAIERLHSYDWAFFTSVNGVDHFLARMSHLHRSAEHMNHIKIVAIGPETARRLEQAGIRPFLVPKKFQAEGILDGLRPEEISGKRILIPRAAQARDILPNTLRQWGGTVDVVEVYRTAVPKSDTGKLLKLLRDKKIDMITFTSSSTVSHFVRLVGAKKLVDLLQKPVIACIGPITSQTAADLGLHADVVSEEYTVSGLVRAIASYYETSGQS